ncbi:MAG: hypothetical protein HY261_05110 [Chloroflexi bacterium]|nr:hypothetical protein [Chloroflexota bacterium]
MEKINVPSFLEIGGNLDTLSKASAEPTKRFDTLIAGFGAVGNAKVLLGRFPGLTVCRKTADELEKNVFSAFEVLNKLPAEKRSQPDDALDRAFQQVVVKAKEFQTVLAAELHTFAAYYVTKKAIYSTDDLIERAENALPDGIRKELTAETKKDLNQAGRCLALDVPTGAGFHINRATERVLLQYRAKFINTPPRDRNWGAYIQELRGVTANPRPEPEVIATLDQIRGLHRNPVIHPEDFLTDDDALVLFNICTSAIYAMGKDLATRFPTPPPAAPTGATPTPTPGPATP